MTRVEFSLHFHDQGEMTAYDIITDNGFPERMNNAIKDVVHNVLNEETINAQVMCKMRIASILNVMSKLDYNALIIGAKNCWVINCITSHKGHCVGT